MGTVTYLDAIVRQELANWVFVDQDGKEIGVLQRVVALGVLGVFPVLGCGCPGCSSRADEARPKRLAALGTETRVPTPSEVKTYQLARLVGKVQGQYVSTLAKDGPAENAGLKVGDVLLALDGIPICSRDDLQDFLRVSAPGTKVQVLVKRAGTFQQEKVTVTLGTGPEASTQGLTWQYAGRGQLGAALAAAKKEGKPLLIGLSGADT
jgi:membrane-associated protease RseP (regulator of RpoE activity)